VRTNCTNPIIITPKSPTAEQVKVNESLAGSKPTSRPGSAAARSNSSCSIHITNVSLSEGNHPDHAGVSRISQVDTDAKTRRGVEVSGQGSRLGESAPGDHRMQSESVANRSGTDGRRSVRRPSSTHMSRPNSSVNFLPTVSKTNKGQVSFSRPNRISALLRLTSCHSASHNPSRTFTRSVVQIIYWFSVIQIELYSRISPLPSI